MYLHEGNQTNTEHNTGTQPTIKHDIISLLPILDFGVYCACLEILADFPRELWFTLSTIDFFHVKEWNEILSYLICNTTKFGYLKNSTYPCMWKTGDGDSKWTRSTMSHYKIPLMYGLLASLTYNAGTRLSTSHFSAIIHLLYRRFKPHENYETTNWSKWIFLSFTEPIKEGVRQE